jgi:hypothetical protein
MINLPTYMDRPVGRSPVIIIEGGWIPGVLELMILLEVMVAENEIERFVQTTDNVLVIIDRQIPSAQNKINGTETALDTVGVNQGIDMISNTEDLHGTHSDRGFGQEFLQLIPSYQFYGS